MIDKVAKTILKFRMTEPHDRVIAAVSGGPDSVALLYILIALSEKLEIELIMAYLNHGLRGDESAREEVFVKQLGKSLKIPVVCKSVDIRSEREKRGKGMSIEEMGRQERHRFLSETAEIYRAQKIALGHHLNDQCETVLMNLIRGSGMVGLKGMLPMRDHRLIRPLIECSKEEIMTFLNEKNISFICDTSNMDDIYFRNKIRIHLMPELKSAYNPGIEKSLHHVADTLRVDNDFLDLNTEKALREMHLDHPAKEYAIKIKDILSYHEAIQNRVINSLLLSFSPAKNGIAYVHIKSFQNLIHGKKSRASINLPFGIEVRREDNRILVHYRPRKTASESIDIKKKRSNSYQYDDIKIPGVTFIREQGISIKFDIIEVINPFELKLFEGKVSYMDYEKIVYPLMIRNKRSGDRINPLGMKGTQRLKSFFINKKVPQSDRERIPVLVDGQSIISIIGMRLSERVKITDKTRTIMKVEII